MVYLIALAMGTMMTLTVFQLIPEALRIYHSHIIAVPCGNVADYHRTSWVTDFNQSRGPINEGTDDRVWYEGELCYLNVGGAQMYIWEMFVLYLMIIMFYNLQVRVIPFDQYDISHRYKL